MKYWIIDAETNTRNRGDTAVGDMAASPYCADNHIVLFGERQGEKNTIGGGKGKVPPYCLLAAEKEKVLLIGHNISFDLKYIKKDWPVYWNRAINNIYIWDTQQVAYLLSGQTHMYPSLDELSLEVGISTKDEKIKEYWENGIDTEDIPLSELEPYLEHDLEATEAVFRYQYEIVKELPALFNLVKVKMDDILCTTMMEESGMAFDLEKAQTLAYLNDGAIAGHHSWCKDYTDGMFEPEFEFNPMSNEHVSLAMFGGKYTLRQRVPVLDEHGVEQFYKTGARAGQVKTRLEDVVHETTGFGLTPPVGATPKKGGIYSVESEVLKKYTIPFVNHIINIREKTKENETYYRGYSALVWPDGKIHASLGHCGTRTGRNNHSKPNLGNVTREEL